MTESLKRYIPVFLVLALCIRFPSCGGAGSGDSMSSTDQSSPTYLGDGLILSWEAPDSYSDETFLDPREELDVYEIYVNRTGEFFPEDEPVAYVAAIDPEENPVESFDLAILDYPFQAGNTYYLSMRSVTKSGTRSDFSSSFVFTILDGADPSPDIDQFICMTPPRIVLSGHTG